MAAQVLGGVVELFLRDAEGLEGFVLGDVEGQAEFAREVLAGNVEVRRNLLDAHLNGEFFGRSRRGIFAQEPARGDDTDRGQQHECQPGPLAIG